jgi:hypothetical protein
MLVVETIAKIRRAYFSLAKPTVSLFPDSKAGAPFTFR